MRGRERGREGRRRDVRHPGLRHIVALITGRAAGTQGSALTCARTDVLGDKVLQCPSSTLSASSIPLFPLPPRLFSRSLAAITSSCPKGMVGMDRPFVSHLPSGSFQT